MKYTIIIITAILTITFAAIASDGTATKIPTVQERVQEQQKAMQQQQSEDDATETATVSVCAKELEKYQGKVVKYENKIAKYGTSKIRLWKLNYYGERLDYWQVLCTPSQE